MNDNMSDLRWRAVVTYLNGRRVTLWFEEFVQLGDLIEGGPDWNTISDISVTLVRRYTDHLPPSDLPSSGVAFS